MDNTTINNDLAGNYIAAMMDLNEFDLNLNFKQAKYLASIMVTMQKHSIDEILNQYTDANQVHKTSIHCSSKLEVLHDLICKFDEEKLHNFNLPIN
jgi:uncharacterized membrane protein affecting hemolysin expression